MIIVAMQRHAHAFRRNRSRHGTDIPPDACLKRELSEQLGYGRVALDLLEQAVCMLATQEQLWRNRDRAGACIPAANQHVFQNPGLDVVRVTEASCNRFQYMGPLHQQRVVCGNDIHLSTCLFQRVQNHLMRMGGPCL